MPKTLARGRITAKSGDNEKLLAINELQTIANSVYRAGPLRLTTTDAAHHIIWTSDDVPEGQTWGVTVTFIGRDVAGVGHIFWVRNLGVFRQPGGVTTPISFTDSVSVLSDAFTQISVAVSGNAVQAIVFDTTARTVNWSAWIEVRVSN
jgi:hypothetical protein